MLFRRRIFYIPVLMIDKITVGWAVSAAVAAVFALEPVDQTVFVALDTETTGLNAETDRILEIGAVKFRADTVIASTNWLIHPQQPIPASASAINGITLETVEHAPVFSVVWPDVQAFCGDAVLLMHNARFDAGFLRSEAVRAGVDLPAFSVIDTLPLFRNRFPAASGHSIETLAAGFHLSGNRHHRAEADAFYLFQLFRLIRQEQPDLTFKEIVREAGGIRNLTGEETHAVDHIKR